MTDYDIRQNLETFLRLLDYDEADVYEVLRNAVFEKVSPEKAAAIVRTFYELKLIKKKERSEQ